MAPLWHSSQGVSLSLSFTYLYCQSLIPRNSTQSQAQAVLLSNNCKPSSAGQTQLPGIVVVLLETQVLLSEPPSLANGREKSFHIR